MTMPHRESVLLKIGQKQVIPWTCGGEKTLKVRDENREARWHRG